MENKEVNIIFENILKEENTLVHSIIKRRLHLQDYSKIIKEKILESTNETNIIDSLKNHELTKNMFDEYIDNFPTKYSDNSDEVSYINEGLLDFDIYYICKQMIDGCDNLIDKKNVGEYFSNSNLSKNDDLSENYIAYVRGPLSNIATEKFAKVIGKSSPYIKELYNTLFRDVDDIENGYAVIPVENITDGRLNFFRNMIDKNELYTILTCEVENNGDDLTKFDLVSSKIKLFDLDTDLYFRFKITFENLNDMQRLQNMLKYCNAKIEHVFSISVGESGRENAFDFIYNVTNADLTLIYCLLKLLFPQFITCGIYNKVG